MASLPDCGQTTPLLEDHETMGTHPTDVDEEKGESLQTQQRRALTVSSSTRSILTAAILIYTNLIIYMSRFSVAGALPALQSAFQMDDSKSGLIKTVFIASYAVVSPVYGYLGDRWNKKIIICTGMAFWTGMTLWLSFIPSEHFLILLLTSGLLGAGEASFCTIAPSIIADLFAADRQSQILTAFYFVIPVGSGLGYIIGSKVTMAAGWRWAFRVTPGLGLIAVILMVLTMKKPTKEATDGIENITSQSFKQWLSDLKRLCRNPSFIFSTLASSAGMFVAGAIGVWAPTYLTRARTLIEENKPCQAAVCYQNDSVIFGAITVISGIIGVTAGAVISKKYRRVNPRADPLVCGCGTLGSAIFLYLALVLGDISIVATYVFIFIAETLLTMHWAIVIDILMYVVPPSTRSTAQALQISISSLLGQAPAPYIIGQISDLVSRGWPESPLLKYRSLEYALMTCAFMAVIGGGFFMATALFIERDRKNAEKNGT